MKHLPLIGFSALTIAAALFHRSGPAADTPALPAAPAAAAPQPAEARAAGAANEQATPSPDPEAQIEMLARFAMPGKHHQLLQRLAGNWTTRTRYWMTPDTPPAEAAGTSRRTWILDRRFLLEELDGGDLALPFRGLGLYGYDAYEQKYSSTWADTMNTATMTNLGTYDPAADAVKFTGHYSDPWTGTKKPSRGLTRFLNPDKHVLELHIPGPDGREFKMLEITYTRRPPETR